MDIGFHVAMHHNIVAGHDFMADFDVMRGFSAHYDLGPDDDMSIHMADAAMGGAVHDDGLGDHGVRRAAVFGAEQGQGDQQRRQSER
jgi:hypothetical protein